MSALSRAHALLQKALERGDGHVVSFQNDELRALLDDATIAERRGFKEAIDKTAPGFQNLGTALRMIRDAVEELAPVGGVPSRDIGPPNPIGLGEDIIAGIQAIIEADREKVAAMMLRVNLATGHGDTLNDLLAELEAQIVALEVRKEK